MRSLRQVPRLVSRPRPDRGRLGTLALAAVVATGLSAALAGCPSDARPLRLDLVLRSSCGVSSEAFDTSCLAALEARLLSEDGDLLESECTPIVGRYASLDALVTSPESLAVLSNLEGRRGIVELRAYQAVDKAPCAEVSEVDLVLWGGSDVVDLADEARTSVTVQLECRPGCDCERMVSEPNVCPAALEPGICAPLDVVRCRRSCDTPTCYGTVPCEAGLCSPATAGLCADCGSSGDCASGLCVENGTTGERFCAERCPPAEGSTPCPPRMSCKSVAEGPFSLVP